MWDNYLHKIIYMQVNLDMTDSMGPGKLVRHMHRTGTKHIGQQRQFQPLMLPAVKSRLTISIKFSIKSMVAKIFDFVI